MSRRSFLADRLMFGCARAGDVVLTFRHIDGGRELILVTGAGLVEVADTQVHLAALVSRPNAELLREFWRAGPLVVSSDAFERSPMMLLDLQIEEFGRRWLWVISASLELVVPLDVSDGS